MHKNTQVWMHRMWLAGLKFFMGKYKWPKIAIILLKKKKQVGRTHSTYQDTLESDST